jgi:hypothetical protein
VQIIKNLVNAPRPRLFFEAGQYLYFIDGISLANHSSFPSGDDAYCIVPSENYFNAKDKYASLFSRITEPFTIEQKRNGKICRRFYVYRLNGYHSNKLLHE